MTTQPSHDAPVLAPAATTDPGEIYDFEFTPRLAGTLTLKFGDPPVMSNERPQVRTATVRVQ